MRAKREGTVLETGRQEEHDVHRLSIRSTSTRSSLLSDNSHSEPLSSSSQSEPSRHPPLPGFGRKSNISGGGGRDSQQSTCFQADSLCGFNVGVQFTQNDRVQAELVDELRSRGHWEQDSVTDGKEALDTSELEAIFHGAPGCGVVQKNVSEGNEKNDTQESLLWAELSYGSAKKKNTTALNAVSHLNYIYILICYKHCIYLQCTHISVFFHFFYFLLCFVTNILIISVPVTVLYIPV